MGIYVVGMHRSGTSAVAGLLSALTRLPAGRLAVPSNPGGQWERPEFRPALELVLALNGYTWAQPPAEGDELGLPGPLAAYATRVFGQHGSGPFLWKDPRLSLTIDHWLTLRQEEPRIVVVHRQPEEVARSLAVRNGWSIERGLALWERTNRNMIVRLAGREVFVVDHQDLLADPAGMTVALETWLGIDAPADRERAAATITPASGSVAEPEPAESPPAGELLGELTDERQALADHLGRARGPARLDLAGIGPESPSTGATLGSPTRLELVRRVARATRSIPVRHRLDVAGRDPDTGS